MKYSFLSAALALTIVSPANAQTAPAAPSAATESTVAKIAFLMPEKGSGFERPSQMALNGVLAANYASKNPFEVLLVRGTRDTGTVELLEQAAQAGAVAAIGPLWRNGIESLAAAPYLPLPVVTLNQIDTDRVITAETPTEPLRTASVQTETGKARLSAKGLAIELAQNRPQAASTTEPRIFPRAMLMFGLSVETDAALVADLGVQALPERTESGKVPRTLIIDMASPLEKRISKAFEQRLSALGHAPDRITISREDLSHIGRLFALSEESDGASEALIDQEADPAAWRRQQLRLQRRSAERRAKAAMAEPPYHAIFLALDANTASLIRQRLPQRARVWATAFANPGNPNTDPTAKALAFDLKNVGLVDVPFLINYDSTEFTRRYPGDEPTSAIAKRLFALGADALGVASAVAQGQINGTLDGLTGKITWNGEEQPLVQRRATPAVITDNGIIPVSETAGIRQQADTESVRQLKTDPKDPAGDRLPNGRVVNADAEPPLSNSVTP